VCNIGRNRIKIYIGELMLILYSNNSLLAPE
jgi:hypothetical protein